MSDVGTSVTLILYKIGDAWWREPALNLIAAAAQMSSYTHVELAIGEASYHALRSPSHALPAHRSGVACRPQGPVAR